MEIKLKSNKIIPLFLIPLLLGTMLMVMAQNVELGDSFHLVDSITIPHTQFFNDAFHLVDSITIAGIHIFNDAFNLMDSLISSLTNLNIVTITTTLTQLVLGQTCSGVNCYSTNGANNFDNTMTQIIMPAMLILVTGFGFMYMGVKSFGVFIVIETFVILMLAYIGIIPSWFSLLVILFVGAAFTKLLLGFFRGSQ